MMKSIKQQDLELGKIGEEKCLPIFREKLDKYLAKTDTYNCMDFISPYSNVELKTRNCNSDRYPSIMIGKNKIQYALSSKRKTYLAFNFFDGLFYYEVKQADIDNGDVFYAMGGRKDRGIDETKEVAYIKSHLLVKLSP